MDPPPPPPAPALHPSDTSFPIIAIAVIGIVATAFLLVSYYVFVIKCCLNWHRIDILRRFSLSRGRAHEEALMGAHSPSAMERRGLEESVIRSIPVFKYSKTEQEEKQGKSAPAGTCSVECAVCLNEFVEEEKLRRIPNCGHVFHIDCIDVWLQSNANCPLCRTSITSSTAAGVGLLLFPVGQAFGSSSPQDPSPTPYPERIDIDGDEDYVVIELGNYVTNSRQSSTDRTLRAAQERLMNSGELLPTPRKLESRFGAALDEKKGRKLGSKGIRSKGDECIDLTRGKEDRFGIQPIRRSFSMDSSADRQLLLKIQEIVQQQSSCNSGNRQNGEVGIPVEGGSSSFSRSRRNFFSFGHNRASKNAVLPVSLE
ncbi:unnamed protein product [Linum tenue]|uniref:RING-type E3 ubiquitin transferase n=2 Tax=Linum tenue TaxID=586396 RepID=A0AAV0NHW3_9ROSI|nr:unnamed protein product [Linum tenue]